MAREKAPPEPPEDIPAWFMTYSDVITLLMTFFILLLTFSTTEPERFERIQQTIFAGGVGSGIAGETISGPEQESFVQRIRQRAARMAMVGSEMAPYVKESSAKSVGKGIKSISDEEAKQDVMTTNQFVINVDEVVGENNVLTPKGVQLAGMLASQLRRLPVHLSVQFANVELHERATTFFTHLYQTEKIRPGQVGVGIVEDIDSQSMRFSVERFEEN